MDYGAKSVTEHKKTGGKIEIKSKMPVTNREELSIAYTPGVAAVSAAIRDNPVEARELIATKKMVAVVTNGTAVLGLGNIGPVAALPVMEGKAVLFKEMAGIDAFPIAVQADSAEEFVKIVAGFAPTFGGINLEDIAAPECFEIEQRLQEMIDIPVFHDDQHGTAIVVLAGLINALKVVAKNKTEIRVVVSGVGAAGTAIIKLLAAYGIRQIVACDSMGVVYAGREGMNAAKDNLLEMISAETRARSMSEALIDADVFIGVSAPNILTAEEVKKMNEKAIVFALANPVPEIMPEEAKAGGAMIIGTGRSDYPNQLNNVLAFPGVFKGLLESGAKIVTNEMKIKAAEALANVVTKPSVEEIIPTPFDERVLPAVSEAVK